MEYIFGTEQRGGVTVETVKMICPTAEAREQSGSFTVERNDAISITSDSFQIVEKIREVVSDGLTYQWYVIDKHYRYIDKFTPGIKSTEQEITDQDLAIMEAEQMITDLDLRVMELEAAAEPTE